MLAQVCNSYDYQTFPNIIPSTTSLHMLALLSSYILQKCIIVGYFAHLWSFSTNNMPSVGGISLLSQNQWLITGNSRLSYYIHFHYVIYLLLKSSLFEVAVPLPHMCKAVKAHVEFRLKLISFASVLHSDMKYNSSVYQYIRTEGPSFDVRTFHPDQLASFVVNESLILTQTPKSIESPPLQATLNNVTWVIFQT